MKPRSLKASASAVLAAASVLVFPAVASAGSQSETALTGEDFTFSPVGDFTGFPYTATQTGEPQTGAAQVTTPCTDGAGSELVVTVEWTPLSTRALAIPPVPIEAPLPIPDENSSVSESSESREESLPESSEAPAFNRASFRVSIENAGGAPGSAGKLREKLVTEGFVVLSAGNAASKSNASLLRSKASVPEAFLNDLIAISKISSSNEMLRNIPDDAESDVIVTIGTESVESAL